MRPAPSFRERSSFTVTGPDGDPLISAVQGPVASTLCHVSRLRVGRDAPFVEEPASFQFPGHQSAHFITAPASSVDVDPSAEQPGRSFRGRACRPRHGPPLGPLHHPGPGARVRGPGAEQAPWVQSWGKASKCHFTYFPAFRERALKIWQMNSGSFLKLSELGT